MDRLFSAVQVLAAISHMKLQDFSLFAPFDRDRSFDYLLQSTSFRHLFRFVNLKDVHVVSVVGIDLDDGIITDMARSWPHLERLELDSMYGTRSPRTTLRCLEAFAQYSPRLTRLGITFDATVIPTSTSQFCHDKLESLDVDASPISEAHPVAQFLMALFPHLNDLGTLADAGIEQMRHTQHIDGCHTACQMRHTVILPSSNVPHLSMIEELPRFLQDS